MRHECRIADPTVEELGICKIFFGNVDIYSAETGESVRDRVLNGCGKVGEIRCHCCIDVCVRSLLVARENGVGNYE